jgi:hypothetical protein
MVRFGTEIEAGYRAVGVAAPDYARLSRKDALAKIAEFSALTAGGDPDAVTALELLETGLKSLHPALIREEWAQ